MKLLLSFLLLFSIKSYSQKDIELKDVSKHIGDSVRIDAVVFGGKYLEHTKGAPTFLNIGGKYPNAPLTLVIWQDVRAKYKHVKIVDYYTGKRVLIYGVLKEFNGKFKIIINNPEQILEITTH